jgi:hypothetical protein
MVIASSGLGRMLPANAVVVGRIAFARRRHVERGPGADARSKAAGCAGLFQ